MSHNRALNSALLGLLLCAPLGCATPSVELKTNPLAAEVSTIGGEVLGETPLRFSPEQLEKLTIAPGKVALRIRARGHIDRDVILELHDESTFEVTLSPADDAYFNRKWLSDFSKQTNTMVREILQIQGYLITKNLSQAEKAIESFENRFSNLAAIYVMKGNLELIKGNKDKGRAYFLRAQSLDPEDPVAARLLRQAATLKTEGSP